MTFRRVSSRTNGVSFFLLETEVTNEMFARYLNATSKSKGDWELYEELTKSLESGHGQFTSTSPVYDYDNPALLWRGDSPPRGHERFPVAFLTIGEARGFCEWLTARCPKVGLFRLPTVEEWVIAAYGDTRNYPWGDEQDLTIPCISLSEHELRTRPARVKVHVKDKTPEEIYDLGGNVAEFVLDLNEFVADTRWMGASFKTYPAPEFGHKFSPRNDYWGYCHSPDSRTEDTGFRVLLEVSESK